MFREVELRRNVAIVAENLNKDVFLSRRYIVTQLLEDLLKEKATEEHGYFLAVTRLKKIGNGEIVDDSAHMSFPVLFNCRTFLPSKGEILQGVVHVIKRIGVLMRCGPLKYAFLSARKMPGYVYAYGKNAFFVNNELAKIEINVVVRFVVFGVRWIEEAAYAKREFQMLASIDGDFLGPVSLCGCEDLDLVNV